MPLAFFCKLQLVFKDIQKYIGGGNGKKTLMQNKGVGFKNKLKFDTDQLLTKLADLFAKSTDTYAKPTGIY